MSSHPGAGSDDSILPRALRHAQAYLASLSTAPVARPLDLTAFRDAVDKPLQEEGLGAAQVIDELVADMTPGLVGSAGGRFFGWVIGGSLPAAVAADWLTAIWDQNAALHACSPAAAVVEEVVGGWLKTLLALPPQCSFGLVTGCQMAHVTCLAAARSALLRRLGWNVNDQGLCGAPKVRILANAQRHASIERAVSLIGLGRANIEPVATDESGRIEPAALHQALRAGGIAPTILILQAGDIATGAFDRFEELIPMAREAGAWVHVDGAFGLWARSSSQFRGLTRSCERADSWATDGHKVLNVPFDCGYAFVAHPQDHKAALSLRAAYLTHADDARDQIDWNPEWSRRARGFATYVALRRLGRNGVAALFEGLCRHARTLAAGLSSLPGAELSSEPIINQALVRFRDPHETAQESDHDRHTTAVIEAINATGEAFFTGTTWNGRRVMRISVCNWRTDEGDVERAIAAARRVLADLAVISPLRAGP